MASDDEREDAGEDAGEDEDAWRGQVLSPSRAEPLHQPATPREGQVKKRGARKLAPIRINLSGCKYEVLRIVQRKLGWREVGDEEDWEVYWTDTSVSIERIIRLNKIQKINHFNGMLEICRKKSMAKNLGKMAKLFPEHYDFFPRTFLLPNDIQELMADVKARGKKQIYIFKPDAGCQGRGIRLIQGGKEEAVLKLLKEMDQPNVVAQHYLTKPLLVNGYKFDLRIYALVLACDPLRVFIFHEGLARFCTEKYVKPKPDNLHISFMHLTNYAVNKHNENFVAANAKEGATDDASKWTLNQLADHLTSQGHDWGHIWSRIQQLIVKSLASIQPVLKNNYRSVLPADNDGFSCFEILGYDIMLDTSLQPWLIEVNHSPSFNIDSPLDLAIKEQLIADTLHLVRIDPKLIAKAKKADKRAAAGRLLEPLQKKKPASGASPSLPAATPSTAAASVSAMGGPGSGTPSGTCTPVATAATAAAAVLDESGGSKPGKSWEEYEAIRAEALVKREKYESKHSGGFTRIYPTSDRTLQGLYDELLRGASELFQSTFQAKAKRALENMGEERRKVRDDPESESVRAEKARVKAHRDKLALMAAERRSRKAAEAATLCGVATTAASINPLAGYMPGPNGMMYFINSRQSSWSTSTRPGLTGMELVFGQVGQRSEVWGESEGCSSAGSLASSRPASARSVDRPGLSHRLSSSLTHAASGMPRILPASIVSPAIDQPGSGAHSDIAGSFVPINAASHLVRAASKKGIDLGPSGAATGNGSSRVVSRTVSGLEAQAGSIGQGSCSMRPSQASSAQDTVSKGSQGSAKSSATSTQQRVVASKEFAMWNGQALVNGSSPAKGAGSSSPAPDKVVSQPSMPAQSSAGPVDKVTAPHQAAQQQLLTSISVPSAGQSSLPHTSASSTSTAGGTRCLPSTYIYDSSDLQPGGSFRAINSSVNQAAAAAQLDRAYSGSLPQTSSQSALFGSNAGDAGSGLGSGGSTRQVCPTFWRSASSNTRSIPLMLSRTGSSALPSAACPPQPSPHPGKPGPQQRPLSGHQHSLMMRMAAMTPPAQGTAADAKAQAVGSQPSSYTLQRAASNPLPCPQLSTVHSFNTSMQIADPTSILGLPRPAGAAAGALRPPSPTSIYIHGPPVMFGGSTSSKSTSYGGMLQLASDASFWPGLSDKMQLGPTNSFVVRPVVVSSKAAAKGGTLYTSLRPAPSVDKAKQAASHGTGNASVLSVTGQRVQVQD